MAIGGNIKRIRTLNKVSVADLARKTGVKPESIYAWERGDYNPSEENLQSVGKVLGVPVKDFYDEKPTQVQERSDNKGNATGIDMAVALQKVVEENSEYMIIPRLVLEGKYRLIPIEEIASKEKELERKNDELIRKDHQIEGLYELFKVLGSGSPAELPKIKKAQKDMGV